MDVLEGYRQGKSHQEYKIEQGSEKKLAKKVLEERVFPAGEITRSWVKP